jgi:rod shape-determining protein MreC
MVSTRTRKIIILSVAAFGLLLFLHFTKIIKPLENLAVIATRPVFGYVYKTSNALGGIYADFKQKNALIDENNNLKEQLVKLQQDGSLWLAEKEENEFLRGQLNFVKENNFEAQIANVIGKSADYAQNSFLLNVGEKNGIWVGQPVVAENGLLIGKIIKVGRYSSLVLLLNDDMSKIAAKIQTESKTGGVLEGEYGLGIRMKYIPKTDTIAPHDLVVTSGLEKLIPAGILIGEVERVDNEPEALFQEASIKSLLDFNKIYTVNVIKLKNVD